MVRILVLSAGVCVGLCGCGAGAPTCDTRLMASVTPASAAADSGAKVPGNQQQFTDADHYVASNPGCPVPALSLLLQPDWTVSDPVHVSISSAKDGTNGMATCLGETAGAVTVTAGAVGSANAATALLTCQ